MDAIAFGGHQHAIETGAFAGEVAQDVDGAPHFAFGFGEGFAFLAGHLLAELFELFVEQISGFEENSAARGRGHGRPCWKSRGRRIGSAYDIGG